MKPEWHTYIGTGIDPEVVHRQARDRMYNKHNPESTVVHAHPAKDRCETGAHSFYNKSSHVVTVLDPGEVTDGHALWGCPDPHTGPDQSMLDPRKVHDVSD